MPPKKRVPKYCLHKPTGQAKVVLNGKTFYLGRYGTAASKQAYDRKIQEWLAAGRRLPTHDTLTVEELISAFSHHAEHYYRKPDGKPTSEIGNLKQAFRPLSELYGDTKASAFGPQELKAVREAMIGRGWLRISPSIAIWNESAACIAGAGNKASFPRNVTTAFFAWED